VQPLRQSQPFRIVKTTAPDLMDSMGGTGVVCTGEVRTGVVCTCWRGVLVCGGVCFSVWVTHFNSTRNQDITASMNIAMALSALGLHPAQYPRAQFWHQAVGGGEEF
jgi:hypothetical protein